MKFDWILYFSWTFWDWGWWRYNDKKWWKPLTIRRFVRKWWRQSSRCQCCQTSLNFHIIATLYSHIMLWKVQLVRTTFIRFLEILKTIIKDFCLKKSTQFWLIVEQNKFESEKLILLTRQYYIIYWIHCLNEIIENSLLSLKQKVIVQFVISQLLHCIH